ncbi:MAG: hypothetical protein CME40_11230 [Haliea sp.]|nr:hypothetical protein [Haliea sp.]|tara:strand:- start:18420 stop:18695 length:276 start_codon:yes stop_codon:yes gene_type:complete
MRQSALFALPAVILLSACSGGDTTQCTAAPQSAWHDEARFRQMLVDQGYQINQFKVTEGNCYEIYGFDPDQTKVEIYFNPVNGSIVKREEG